MSTEASSIESSNPELPFEGELGERVNSIRQTLEQMQAKLSEIQEVATQASAAKTQIADAQGIIATKSEHIQNAQEHADKVRGELERILTAANKSSVDAEGLKVRAQAAADIGAELLATIRANNTLAESEATAIQKAKEAAKDASEATKSLAEKAAAVDQKVAGYETRLAELEKQCRDQLDTITGLLPGATSAGLASAFDARRRTFLSPGKLWQWVFVGSLLFIVVFAYSGLRHANAMGGDLTLMKLLLAWLSRIPIVLALVWLALHASREAALAKRLEEDYGYKATIAASFQGFMEQMAKLGKTEDGTPLAKLSEDTLKTIADSPGRIYEKHRLTVSPSTMVREAASVIGARGEKKE